MHTISELPLSIRIQRSTLISRSDSPRRGSRPKHTTQLEETLFFAALEHGTTWTTAACPAHAHFVHQDAGETPKEFARRVVRVLANGVPPRASAALTLVFALACGTRLDQLEARCSIATALLRHCLDAEFELVLLCNRDSSSDERAHALALAEGLCEGQRARSVSVCLDA
jgi:hypothetical protein